ncbi:MAG: hypothetical protein Q9M28_08155 [Mariprofundaceae bacterium]|nr:hypothetical protein [Mariprofundaceae bacterium]
MLNQLAANILTQTPLLQQRIMQQCELNDHDVMSLFTELLKYLEVNAKSSQKRTPSIVVDDAWHEFILFTKLYAQHCHQHYGKFIHHRPGGTSQENQQQYMNTIKDIVNTFGTFNAAYWPIPCWMSLEAQCGSCD